MMNIDFSKLASVSDYAEYLGKKSDKFLQLSEDATEFISSHDWCLSVLDNLVGMYYEGIVGVFLFQIAPSNETVDEWVWVVVGDLPPIYITIEDSPNAACALDSYIGGMEEWVDAVKTSQSVQGLIPVNAPPTLENANALDKRLKFLDEKILCHYKEELKT